MIVDRPRVTAHEFAEATGWSIQPRGACRGEICVPLAELSADQTDPASLDLAAIADRLGMAAATDDASGLRAYGPAAINGRALPTAEAPSLVLPDLDGEPFDLASLRGSKVVMVAWSPY